jgi:SAM-dependent methyltransferase
MFVPDLISVLPSAAIILDLGCGTGLQAREMAAAGYRVLALDSDFDALETAAGLGGEALDAVTFHPHYLNGVGERLPFHDATFQAVVCFDVFHWAAHEEAFRILWREAWRVLKPGGLFVFRTLIREDFPDAVPVSAVQNPMDSGRYRLASGAVWFLASQQWLDERLLEVLGSPVSPTLFDRHEAGIRLARKGSHGS